MVSNLVLDMLRDGFWGTLMMQVLHQRQVRLAAMTVQDAPFLIQLDRLLSWHLEPSHLLTFIKTNSSCASCITSHINVFYSISFGIWL